MTFQWLNESAMHRQGDIIEIHAPAGADYFCPHDAVGEEGITASAPFYYTEIEGDFVARVKVSLEFRDTYDSACLMVMKDLTHWAKACYELTDFGTHAAVSVVTNGLSDDANGCEMDCEAIWLQVCRQGQSFAFHYSLDGETFHMMRFFHLPVEEKVRLGLAAQAPVGQGGMRRFEQLAIERRSVSNLRAGQ